MQAVATAEAAIRQILLDNSETQNYEIRPVSMLGKARISIVYRLLSPGADVASSSGQTLYATFLFQVVATTVAESIDSIAILGGVIRDALHFDADRRAQLPAGIRSMQVERDINFPEPSTAGGIRQNLGVVVRVMV